MPRVLQRIARRDRPIIVGPWVSEVGFELLYWIPFLNWVTTQRPVRTPIGWSSSRVAAARPGTATSAARYVDLFDYYTPEQFREQSEQRITDRQAQAADDVRIRSRHHQARAAELASSRRRPAAPDAHVPAVPRVLAEPRGRRRSSRTSRCSRRCRRSRPAIWRAGFRTTTWRSGSISTTRSRIPRRNRRFVADLLNALAETTDVVLLNPATQLDDHQRCADGGARPHPRHLASDVAADEPRRPVEGHRAGARVRRHAWRAVVPAAAVRRQVAVVLLGPAPVHRAASRAGAARVHRACSRARTSRSTSTISTRCGRRWASSTKRVAGLARRRLF